MFGCKTWTASNLAASMPGWLCAGNPKRSKLASIPHAAETSLNLWVKCYSRWIMHVLWNVDILKHFISIYPCRVQSFSSMRMGKIGASLPCLGMTWGPLRERCGQGQLFNLCLLNSTLSTWRTRSTCLFHEAVWKQRQQTCRSDDAVQLIVQRQTCMLVTHAHSLYAWTCATVNPANKLLNLICTILDIFAVPPNNAKLSFTCCRC